MNKHGSLWLSSDSRHMYRSGTQGRLEQRQFRTSYVTTLALILATSRSSIRLPEGQLLFAHLASSILSRRQCTFVSLYKLSKGQTISNLTRDKSHDYISQCQGNLP